MKYITVPEDITVTPPPEIGGQSETVSFHRYAVMVWLDDTRALEGGFTKQLRWAKVIAAFESCKAGDVLALEDEDFGVLKSIVEKPQRGFTSAMVTVQLVAFPQALLDATEKDPRAVANGEARAS